MLGNRGVSEKVSLNVVFVQYVLLLCYVTHSVPVKSRFSVPIIILYPVKKLSDSDFE